MSYSARLGGLNDEELRSAFLCKSNEEREVIYCTLQREYFLIAECAMF
jgi:hypothetical protein